MVSKKIETILVEDSLEELEEAIACGLSYDSRVTNLSDDFPEIVKSDPPIISFAAFYQAGKCFKHLMINGSRLDLVDLKNIFLFYLDS